MNSKSQNNSLTFVLLVIGIFLVGTVFIINSWMSAAPTQTAQTVDARLRQQIDAHSVAPVDMGPAQDPAQVELGRMLFFDKELSGNRDISCATCHHPNLAGADGRALPVGTGGNGLGTDRVMGKGRSIVPRNAPELFNRGSAEWVTMFWDGRVSNDVYFDSPAEEKLPGGLTSALAAQAMFPPTSRDEMRGDHGDKDIRGKRNEVAGAPNDDPTETWRYLTNRLLSIPEYQALFLAAYPDTDLKQIGFQHAANAIAAFEIQAFSFDDSPWERYLSGQMTALSAEEKAGALLFYGKANCASCHTGSLMTDQQFHNIAVPQLGPGKNNTAGFDFGRYLESNNPDDRFTFRTPPLANIALTAPYMHNGAYATLEGAVRHHLNAAEGLHTYDVMQLDESLRDSCKMEPEDLEYILQTLDPAMAKPINLSESEFGQLMAFLHALTSPTAEQLDTLVPDRVPSGLAITD